MGVKLKSVFLSLLAFSMVANSGIYTVKAIGNDRAIDATISINSDHVLTNNFEGFGIQWDPSDLYTYTDEQWASFTEKARFLKPNMMRVMIHDADSYCIGFDENQKPIYNWDSIFMKRLYKILDFAQENNIPIMIGEWNSPSDRGYLSFDEYGKTLDWDSQTWSDMIVDVLNYLTIDKGYTCIRYYNMTNEPQYRDGGSEASKQRWVRAIKTLRKTIDASQNKLIKDIKIVGPDVYSGWEGWLDKTTSEELRDSIGLHEIHWYASNDQVYNGEVEDTLTKLREKVEAADPNGKAKGFALGEMGISTGKTNNDQQIRNRTYQYGVEVFDMSIQAMRAGLKFGSGWGFEDSMHIQSNDVVNDYKDQYGPAAKTEEGCHYQVHTPTGDVKIDNNVKIWGFWNELGEEMAVQNKAAGYEDGTLNNVKASDEQLRPWYYTWSMLCRYFPEGSKVIAASDSDISRLRTTAAIIPHGDKQNDLSIAAVNSSNVERTVTLNVPNVIEKASLNQYLYYDGKIDGQTRPQNAKGQLLPYQTLKDADLSKGVTITLPANSCTILTTLGYEGESHPIDFTTGRLPEVEKLKIDTSNDNKTIMLNKEVQMIAKGYPSESQYEVEWKVTDYFGNPTTKAKISADGKVKALEYGIFKVVANIKGKPEITSEVLLESTSGGTIIDNLASIGSDGVAKEYNSMIVDGNPGNFDGNKTIKRATYDYTTPCTVVYQVPQLNNYEFMMYSLHDEVKESGNFVIEVSTDGKNYEAVESDFAFIRKLKSNWREFKVTPTAPLKEDTYQYLRIVMKSIGFEDYDPQYAGGKIMYGTSEDNEISSVKVNTTKDIIGIDETLAFQAKVLPSTNVQDVIWQVKDIDGKLSDKAQIDENGILTSKKAGHVIVEATAKNTKVSGYAKLTIKDGYFVDEIENFDKMYQHGDFTFDDKASSNFTDTSRIKRLSDSQQSIVYALSHIEKAVFDVYKNGQLSDDSVDIYTSTDGLVYQKVTKTISDAGVAASGSTFHCFKVATKDLGKNINFVKLEIKNDDSIFCPMIGKAQIDYQADGTLKVIDLSIDQKEVSLNVGRTVQLNAKFAPLYAKEQIKWVSNNKDIVTVDEAGLLSGHAVGSTSVYAKYNDEIYASCVVNVLGENKAFKKETTASSDTNQWTSDSTKALATDGDYETRWVSHDGENIKEEYITVDLGEITDINNVKIYWEAARAKNYNIEVSNDGQTFKTIKEIKDMSHTQLMDDVTFDLIQARYVKIHCLIPETIYGYSIYELEVYDNSQLKDATKIEFNDVLNELYLGEKAALKVKVTPEDATYQEAMFTSDNENVIVCKNNQMIAVGIGTTTITAHVNGQKVTQEVTVVKDNIRKIINELTSLIIENGQVKLSEFEGYELSIFSTDNEKIISKNGQVHQPVEDVDVYLVITVSKNDETANTKEIKVTVTGEKGQYQALMKRLNEVEATDWSLYKEASFHQFKLELTKVKELLSSDYLLVSEVEKASQQLEKAYQLLEKKETKPVHPADKPDIDVKPNPDNQQKPNPGEVEQKPQTGDQNALELFALMSLISLGGCINLLRKRKEDK